MILRDRQTGELLTAYDVIIKFPNTSFPRDAESWNAQVLDFAGVDKVIEVAKPEDTVDTVFVDGGIQNINGQWTQTWNSIPKYTEEQITQIKWDELRKERNSILLQMDKVLIKHKELIELGYKPFEVDGVFSQEMYLDILNYKNKLRDLPNTVTDINNVVWPSNPISSIQFYKDRYLASSPITSIDQLN